MQIMHQLIPPVSIPPGNPGAFVQVLCPRGRAFVHPMATPREFDTPGFKTVKNPGRQVAAKCVFYSFAMEAFVGKDVDFVSQWLIREGLDKLVEIFRGEFSNFRKFSSAL